MGVNTQFGTQWRKRETCVIFALGNEGNGGFFESWHTHCWSRDRPFGKSQLGCPLHIWMHSIYQYQECAVDYVSSTRQKWVKPLLTVAEHNHGTNSHAHAHGFPYKCLCCNPLAHTKNLQLSLGSSSSALGILRRLRRRVFVCRFVYKMLSLIITAMHSSLLSQQ